MDTLVLLLIILVICVLAGVLLLYREVRRMRVSLTTQGQDDPCRDNKYEMRMRCVDRRLQDLDRRF